MPSLLALLGKLGTGVAAPLPIVVKNDQQGLQSAAEFAPEGAATSAYSFAVTHHESRVVLVVRHVYAVQSSSTRNESPPESAGPGPFQAASVSLFGSRD
jgi:hypothetical protein